MNRPARVDLVVLIVVAAVIVVAGFLVGPRDFVWQTVGSFAAVVVGVPVALWLASLQQAKDDEAVGLARLRDTDALLEAIQTDFKDTLEDLTWRNPESPARIESVPFLGSHLAERLGERFGQIDDPRTLGAISRAYDRIATTAELERTLYQARLNTFPGPGGGPPATTVRDHLIDQDRHTGDAIRHALTRIHR
jgi:hypothetical protein